MIWNAAPLNAFTKQLKKGWNLISLPEQPENTDPGVVFDSILDNCDKIFAYDAFDDTDPWKEYDPADPASADLTHVDHTMGFWVNMLEQDSLVYSGIEHPVTLIPLRQGKNVIGKSIIVIWKN